MTDFASIGLFQAQTGAIVELLCGIYGVVEHVIIAEAVDSKGASH